MGCGGGNDIGGEEQFIAFVAARKHGARGDSGMLRQGRRDFARLDANAVYFYLIVAASENIDRAIGAVAAAIAGEIQ